MYQHGLNSCKQFNINNITIVCTIYELHYSYSRNKHAPQLRIRIDNSSVAKLYSLYQLKSWRAEYKLIYQQYRTAYGATIFLCSND